MREIRYTLVCDGVSDEVLLPILTWLLHQHLSDCAVQPRWLDVRLLRKRPQGLMDKIRTGIQLFPCELLFVHRDAEREPPENRVEEIRRAIVALQECEEQPVVCVIPVHMTEAWLLFDDQAIRAAAGNPNGDVPLQRPQLNRMEELPDPKETLKEQLRKASGLKGRRLRQFNVNHAARRVAEFIEDFTLLRSLSAFRALEADIRQTIFEHGWLEPDKEAND